MKQIIMKIPIIAIYTSLIQYLMILSEAETSENPPQLNASAISNPTQDVGE